MNQDLILESAEANKAIVDVSSCVSCDVPRFLQNHQLKVEACWVMVYLFLVIAWFWQARQQKLPAVSRRDTPRQPQECFLHGILAWHPCILASLHACVCLVLLQHLGLSLCRSGSSITSATLKQLKRGMAMTRDMLTRCLNLWLREPRLRESNSPKWALHSQRDEGTRESGFWKTIGHPHSMYIDPE